MTGRIPQKNSTRHNRPAGKMADQTGGVPRDTKGNVEATAFIV